MKLNDSSFLNSVNFSLNEEKKTVKRIKSEKNILPKIKDYLNISNSKVFKTTTINTSNNNSIINNKTFSKNLSENNIIKDKIKKKKRNFYQFQKKRKIMKNHQYHLIYFQTSFILQKQIKQIIQINKIIVIILIKI